MIIPYWIWQWNKAEYKLHKADVFKYTLNFKRIPIALDSLLAKLLMWGSKDKELSKIKPNYFDRLTEERLETNGDEIRDKLALRPRLFGCVNIKSDFDTSRVCFARYHSLI